MTNSQAAAVISAHLAGQEPIQEFSHATLDDLAQSSFGTFQSSPMLSTSLLIPLSGGLFQPNFAHSPTSDSHFLLPEHSEAPHEHQQDHQPEHAGGSAQDLSAEASSSALPPDTDAPPSQFIPKRGRGRPKGSKNKPKANPPPPKPPKIKEKKPIGRPRKQRTTEEEVEYNKRLEEKRLGIKRKKGRPRKYEGYLVRDMRLKRNRVEFAEVIRRHREMEVQKIGLLSEGEASGLGRDGEGEMMQSGGEMEGVHDGMDGGMAHDHEHAELERTIDVQYDWEHDPQSLLEVVGRGIEGDEGMQVDDQDGGEPSAQALGIGKGDEDMREVFGLEQPVEH
jgi:hypothetical protein